jgi:membrane-associated protease RseP (regulator of RpoE activity)
VRNAVARHGGETVPVAVERDGAVEEVPVAIAAQTPDGADQGFLGVAPTAETRRLGPLEGLGATVSGDFSIQRLTAVTVDGIVQVFSPQGLASFFGQVADDAPRSVEGPVSPVGIAQAISAFGQQGDLFAVFVIFAQLNLVLGLLNMAPLPPLDGGHVATLAVEETVNGVRRWTGKPGDWRIDPAVLTPIALTVIVGFTVIFLTALYLDISNPITDLLQ